MPASGQRAEVVEVFHAGEAQSIEMDPKI
jgi:hypothetical protein